MSFFSDGLSGIIADDATQIINDVITHCQKSCRIIYPVSKYISDSSLSASDIGDQPGSVFSHGMPGPFRDIVGNPLMSPADDNKRPVITTEDVNLCVFYDEKKWYPTSYKVSDAQGYIQTFCSRDLTGRLLRAHQLIVDTDIENIYSNRYERSSGPEFCGWNSEYVILIWRKAGNA